VVSLPYAPFAALLPHARLFVHHGGVGSMAEAFRAGVPQIVVPTAHDQPDNAAHLERLGAGVAVAANAGARQFALAVERAGSVAVRSAASAVRERMAMQGGAAARIAAIALG
jgi:rhamnosyltransferase subunit B